MQITRVDKPLTDQLFKWSACLWSSAGGKTLDRNGHSQHDKRNKSSERRLAENSNKNTPCPSVCVCCACALARPRVADCAESGRARQVNSGAVWNERFFSLNTIQHLKWVMMSEAKFTPQFEKWKQSGAFDRAISPSAKDAAPFFALRRQFVYDRTTCIWLPR